MEILLLLIALILAFLHFHFNSPTVIGSRGERRVSSILRRKLDKQNYILLEDLTLPTGRGTTQVDHIVLSPFGIFVIETKNMSGWIFGGETQARWTQIMHHHKSQFQNPLRQNYQHVKVIQNLLGISLDHMENLIAFVGSAEPRTEMPLNVFWDRWDLLDYIASQKAVRFTDEQVRDFAYRLQSSALEPTKETRRAHVQNVRENAQKKADLSNCPRCGSKLIERTNRKTGQTFFGCSRYPNCRGTRQAS